MISEHLENKTVFWGIPISTGKDNIRTEERANPFHPEKPKVKIARYDGYTLMKVVSPLSGDLAETVKIYHDTRTSCGFDYKKGKLQIVITSKWQDKDHYANMIDKVNIAPVAIWAYYDSNKNYDARRFLFTKFMVGRCEHSVNDERLPTCAEVTEYMAYVKSYEAEFARLRAKTENQ